MSDDPGGTVNHLSSGGMAATHPDSNDPRTTPVAPVYTGEENTLRMRLVPKACWKLEDIKFAFDSSFVLPEAVDELPHLHALVTEHSVTKNGATRKPPLCIFGHTDPTGSDVYNKALGERRATAVYGALTRRTDLWEHLYSNPPDMSGDNWKRVDCISIMLGKVIDATGDKTADVKTFQQQNGLTVDGDPGPQTRQKLFLAYMDYLCGKDFVVDKTEFLAQGADPNNRGDLQSCSRFNPVLIFSSDHLNFLQQPENHTQRDKENAINRRVVIFLFAPGRKVSPDKWPCPTAAQGIQGCINRFWADGEQRRANGPAERKFADKHDTFACRFYQRFADSSPCEDPPKGLGFLSVIVYFHQQPIADLKVQFYEMQGNEIPADDGNTIPASSNGSSPSGNSNGASSQNSISNMGAAIGGVLTTDKQGIAKLTKPVPIGNYICAVQYQPVTVVPTVADVTDPFILVLPIGRPYYDFQNDYEFKQNGMP